MSVQSPECSPREAIQSYLAIGSSELMGDLPCDQLRIWREAVSATRLSPENRLHAGWINVDLAWSLYNEHTDPDELTQAVTPVLRESELFFEGVSKDSQSDRMLKMQATVARVGLTAHRAVSMGAAHELEEQYAKTAKEYARVADFALREYQKSGSLSYIPFLHTLTMSMLCQGMPHKDMLALPAPSRAHHVPDGQSSWSLIIADLRTKDVYPLRMGEQGPSLVESFSATEFRNDTYPTKHGQGFLQALLDRHKELPHHSYKRNRLEVYGPADAHVRPIAESIITTLRERPQRVTARPEEFPEDPIATYRSMDVTRYAGWLDDRQLEQMIGKLETTYTTHRSKMTATERQIFGWIQLESALETKIAGRPAVALEGQFDRAEDIMDNAIQTHERKGDRVGAYAAKLDRAALPIYRMIVGAGTSPGEDIQATYKARLVAIAVEMLDELAAVDSLSTFPRDIAQTAHEITACLTLMDQSDNTFLATPATPRQRYRGGQDKGWDITIWPLSRTGFRSDYYGKIRIADAADPASIDKGIVTIPHYDFDEDRTYGFLWNLAAKVQGMAIEDAAKAYIESIAKRLISADDLIV